MSTAEIYTIFCLIEGQENPFSIEITSNKTVDQLKEAIKTKKFKTLTNVEADTLKLYYVSILIPDPQDEDVPIDYAAKVQEEVDKHPPPTELKIPMRKLNRVFNGIPPPDNTLHILVRLPSG
jgi:hypothetical protein